jgi:hypothetical protein
MAQWFAAKADHPDALLFFRMGDFYELFFADAEAAAAALDIALSHRGEHAGVPIPMCGVPHHAAEVYLARLIRRGFRIAIVEQMEDPKARTGKLPIKRAVVRIITPGTITEESLLEAGRPNLLPGLMFQQDFLEPLPSCCPRFRRCWDGWSRLRFWHLSRLIWVNGRQGALPRPSRRRLWLRDAAWRRHFGLSASMPSAHSVTVRRSLLQWRSTISGAPSRAPCPGLAAPNHRGTLARC